MQRYLKLFLEKLPEQTIFDRLEIVLDHNDPSPEELEWVSNFQERYPGIINHIRTSPVVPIGVSMNTCIRAARGKYLAIWNVDDLRTPDSLEAQMRALEENQAATVACGPYRSVSRFGSTSGEVVDNRSLPPEEHHRGMTVGPFFMFRASICKKAGLFDEQLRSGADFDLALRLLHQGKPVFTENNLGYYLNEGLGASTRPNSLQELEANVIYMRYGIWDKLAPKHLPDILAYCVNLLKLDGTLQSVAEFFPNYHEVLVKRREEWFPLLSKEYGLAPNKPLKSALSAKVRSFVETVKKTS
jgi:GT2 family glycosyltransferase